MSDIFHSDSSLTVVYETSTIELPVLEQHSQKRKNPSILSQISEDKQNDEISFISYVILVLKRFKRGILDLQINSGIIQNYFDEITFPDTKCRLRLFLKIATLFSIQKLIGIAESPHQTSKQTFRTFAASAISVLVIGLYVLTSLRTRPITCVTIFVVPLMVFLLESFQTLLPDVYIIPILPLVVSLYSLHLMEFHNTIVLCLALSFIVVKMQTIFSNNDVYNNNPASHLSYIGATARYDSFWYLHDKPLTKGNERFIGDHLHWLTLNLIGSYVFCMTTLRRLSAFREIGQNVLIRQGIIDKEKEEMKWISAVMPSSIIPEYMKFFQDRELREKKSEQSGNVPSVFNKSYSKVSILFADIVGFTMMSSNKSASEVVRLLNDLFNRFDVLCCDVGCEKIGTLGDCYYCVAGCPSPRRDHAICCVRMGLGMCSIIKVFNKDHKQNVNMRVGVHSGRVNAAVIGKVRFRFDVYSYAVIVANGMEITGEPGRVHISEDTYKAIGNSFKVEQGYDYKIRKEVEIDKAGKTIGEEYIKTYFVVDFRTQKRSFHYNHSNYLYPQTGTTSSSQSGRYQRKDSVMSAEQNIFLSDVKINNMETNKVSIDPNRPMTDEMYVDAIRTDPEHQYNLFQQPPVHPITLKFLSVETEKAFNDPSLDQNDNLTLESASLAPILDCFAVISLLSFISVSQLFYFENTFQWIKSCWINSILLAITIALLIPLLRSVLFGSQSIIQKHHANKLRNIRALFLSFTVITMLTISFPYKEGLSNGRYAYFYTNRHMLRELALMTSLIVMSGSPFLNVICVITKFIWLLKFTIDVEKSHSSKSNPKNITEIIQTDPIYFCPAKRIEESYYYGQLKFTLDGVAEMACTTLLVIWLIIANHFNLRLCFYAKYEANRKRQAAEETSQRIEDLLFNIVPKYVMKKIRKRGSNIRNASYAVAIENAGVSFACVCNFFSHYYSEDYKGGESALAILNMIICMFDENMAKYKDVEKIKSINECYMIASGLNSESVDRNIDKCTHLYNLMDYCFKMLSMIKSFNDTWIIGDQKFELQVGYNFGPVTAGIIGTSKPLYDIWGDTVNVSSRMYSTARPGVIQCPKSVRLKLRRKFQFRRRGYIYVKGKGEMMTYLCEGRK